MDCIPGVDLWVGGGDGSSGLGTGLACQQLELKPPVVRTKRQFSKPGYESAHLEASPSAPAECLLGGKRPADAGHVAKGEASV